MRRTNRVPSMEVFRGDGVDVISTRPQPRQLDGDLIDTGDRLFAAVVPGAVWLCVPQPAGVPDLTEDADAAAREEQPTSRRRHRHRTGTLAGGSLAYTLAGAGEPILLVDGLGGNTPRLAVPPGLPRRQSHRDRRRPARTRQVRRPGR
jgi:hypothetical protein